jgi:geranylgeranyl transferase type-2 subunit alpha
LALPRPLTEDVLYKEIELIQQAVFTEPDDQSGWFYYRWVFSSLIQRTKDIVFFTQKQIEWVQELVDIEENSKWAIGTLAFLYKNLYKNIQEEEEANNAKNKAIELYQQLQEIDSGHAFYYQDMITSMQ